MAKDFDFNLATFFIVLSSWLLKTLNLNLMRTTNFMKKIHQVMSPVKILNLIALLLAGNLASQSMPNLRVFS